MSDPHDPYRKYIQQRDAIFRAYATPQMGQLLGMHVSTRQAAFLGFTRWQQDGRLHANPAGFLPEILNECSDPREWR